ncbi:MAG: peptidoglycan DD-metalloendopeptidase family protein [Xanthobacteraceae bacterium]|jgi:murein DD-endopeptidase MepM/ murein hydrolase activator NlpD
MQLAAAAVGRGYALVHAGRQLRLGPAAFWVVVGTLVVMTLWTIGTATYFAFREDVLTRLIARQAEMQFGYEDRIAELRAQVDRISSRQLLDQEQYEQKLDHIVRRQSALESRASALGGLPDPAPTGSIKPPARGGAPEPLRAAPLKPSPINDMTILGPAPDRRAGRSGVDAALARLQGSLDRVEQRQANALNSLEDNYDAKARRMRGVLADIGLDARKLAGVAGTGGPLVPVRAPTNVQAFEQQMQRISLARAQVDRLARTLSTVPLRKPLAGDVDLSSGFGVRTDPFTRSPAMHTGLDLQGETGDPVRATANGTVTSAGWSGGYGKVIDIDHGNGIATRYGHLSSIDVQVGQSVKIGQIIGKVGSTGRSTGPHLHYETRVAGEAVDPNKFLRAGQKLDGGH